MAAVFFCAVSMKNIGIGHQSKTASKSTTSAREHFSNRNTKTLSPSPRRKHLHTRQLSQPEVMMQIKCVNLPAYALLIVFI